MKVIGSMKCSGCGARWTLVGEQKQGDEICPNCRAVGEPESKKPWPPGSIGARHSVGAESQKLQPLPPEQANIRLATKRYVEAVEAFDDTLDEERNAFVRCTTRETLMALGKFASFLEGIGLPLEEDVEEPLPTKSNQDVKDLGKEIEMTLNRILAARTIFRELYSKETE
jgi:hypothetical protein